MLFSGAVPSRPTNVARDTKERVGARARDAAGRARAGRNMVAGVQTNEMCSKRMFLYCRPGIIPDYVIYASPYVDFALLYRDLPLISLPRCRI